jgi:hypothetical protein
MLKYKITWKECLKNDQNDSNLKESADHQAVPVEKHILRISARKGHIQETYIENSILL